MVDVTRPGTLLCLPKDHSLFPDPRELSLETEVELVSGGAPACGHPLRLCPLPRAEASLSQARPSCPGPWRPDSQALGQIT